MTETNKYRNIFSEFRNFLFQLRLLEQDENAGLSKNEIENFQARNNLNLEDSLVAYLGTFGKHFRKNLKTNEFTVFTSNTIEYALKEAKRANLKEQILRCINFDHLELEKSEIDRILPVYFVEYSACFNFVINGTENPYVYTFFEGDLDDGDHIILEGRQRLVDSMRNQVFLKLFYHYKLKGDSDISFTKIDKIEWMKAYQLIIEKRLLSTHDIIRLRKEYAQMKIMNFAAIDKFENEFIQFLIEEKRIEAIKDVYDPNNEPELYKDYLNEN